MAKYLVIVESPAKVKTIKKFLGSNYDVQASNGHVRDFPKSQFGIDVDNDFEPKYITIRGKGELLAGLRKAAKKAEAYGTQHHEKRHNEVHGSKGIGAHKVGNENTVHHAVDGGTHHHDDRWQSETQQFSIGEVLG